MFDKFYDGLADVKAMLGSLSIALTLGWQDIRLRYRRSKIGPFWITISTGVMVAMIGIIFGQALSMPMQEYLPFLSTGLILWTFISSAINEGSSAFIEASGMIRQLAIPMSTYPVRVLVRNAVILGHNIIIIPIVLLIVGKPLTWNVLFLIPGFLIVVINVFWISLVSGILCTRFRDMPSIVSNIIQVFFYLTPIIWIPSALSPRTANLIVEPNPFYHLLEIIRGPVLGYCPSIFSWSVTILTAVVGLVLSFAFFGKFKDRIAYWV